MRLSAEDEEEQYNEFDDEPRVWQFMLPPKLLKDQRSSSATSSYKLSTKDVIKKKIGTPGSNQSSNTPTPRERGNTN